MGRIRLAKTATTADSQLFSLVEAAIRKAWEAKHPPGDQADVPVPPRRKRGVRYVHNASGVADVIDYREEGESA
jgi:hypothetical protein